MDRFCTAGLPSGWKEVLDEFFQTARGRALRDFLSERITAGAVVYPPDPYKAFRLIEPAAVRVVILGQDPYHGPGQAMGLAFSVPRELKKLPPSLKNIFKEIALEFDAPVQDEGDLSAWAQQGVLLINSSLSVEQGKPLAHAGLGWEELTDRLMLRVLQERNPTVFMLWGAWAQKKAALIKENKKGEVLILQANHPSPLSARRPPVPFIGCGHFKKANLWLQEHGENAVLWSTRTMQAELF